MNERIKELQIDANLFADEFWERKSPQWHQCYTEKFAELIVQECVRVAKDPDWYSESPSDGWRNPINHVCNVMKEHFGVEK